MAPASVDVQEVYRKYHCRSNFPHQCPGFCMSQHTVHFRMPLHRHLFRNWNLGNGNTSQQQCDNLLYCRVSYTVKLVNKYAASVRIPPKDISVLDKPVVNFNAANTIACKAPLTVNFRIFLLMQSNGSGTLEMAVPLYPTKSIPHIR